MTRRKRRLPNRVRTVLRALPLLAFAALLTLLLDSVGGLRKIETATLDAQASLLRGGEESPVSVVNLGRGELRPDALQNLLDTIAATRPKAIAITLDTSDASFANIREPQGFPLIWGRNSDYSPRHRAFVVRAAAGGSPRALTAVAVQRVDSDKVIRRYEHVVPTERGAEPTLGWATVCAVRGRRPIEQADRRNEFLLRWQAFDRPSLPAQHILTMARDAEAWKSHSLLTGKIVVIGADLWNAANEYRTPVGWLVGSELVAQAIETELAGPRIVPLPLPLLLFLQVLQGVLLLLLFSVLSFRKALAVSVVAIPLLSFGLSLLFFSTLARWGAFAPILLVLVGQQVYEHAKESRKSLLQTAQKNFEAPKA